VYSFLAAFKFGEVWIPAFAGMTLKERAALNP